MPDQQPPEAQMVQVPILGCDVAVAPAGEDYAMLAFRTILTTHAVHLDYEQISELIADLQNVQLHMRRPIMRPRLVVPE